jgi:uncharacterized protein (DUF58 family)
MALLRNLVPSPVWIPLRPGPVRIAFRHGSLLLVWLVLTVLAYQTGRDIFFRLSHLILAILLLSFLWAVYSVLTFQLERRLVTPRTQVGRVAEERFLVHNTGWLAKVWIEIFDESELPVHRVSRVLNNLRARARWGWSVRTRCRRRGRFQLGPITIAGGDPFGLFTVYRRLPETTTGLIVYPAAVDLLTFSPPLGNLPGGDALHRRTHNTTTNVSGTREYSPGDSFNRVHWRSTARMDRLIVKEFELDPAADVWVFLDLERAVQASRFDEEWVDSPDVSSLWVDTWVTSLAPTTEEYAVTLAASVAKYFIRQQRTVGLVAYGNQREKLQPDRGERQLDRLLEVLAVLRGEGGTPFSHVLAVESAHLGRDTTLVAITPSTDLEWIKSAQEAKRRGLRVITILVDATTFGGSGNPQSAVAELLARSVPTYLVRRGDDLRTALGQ